MTRGGPSWSCWYLVVCIALTLPSVCKSQASTKKPLITYVAGPNQLTLLLDDSAFRFGYDTDNQFRAERRFPNGTVAGYYGYIRADGIPVRVKYGAVDDLGFTAIQEIIPDKFPEEATTEPSEPEGGSGATESSVDEEGIKEKDVVFLPHNEPIIDDEKESVSIDAADFFRDGLSRTSQDRFVFPEIDVPDLPRRRTSRSAQWLQDPIPVQRTAQRRIVAEKQGNEPTIIYAEPVPMRIYKIATTRFTTN